MKQSFRMATANISPENSLDTADSVDESSKGKYVLNFGFLSAQVLSQSAQSILNDGLLYFQATNDFKKGYTPKQI